MNSKKSWGGSRPGAGRKKTKPGLTDKVAPVIIDTKDKDMLTLLQEVALGKVEATPLQVRAAIAAVQYTHQKLGEGGKKLAAEGKAKDANAGRLAPIAPPKLVASGGKKL